MQHNYITISLGLPEFVVERVEETEHLIESGVRKNAPLHTGCVPDLSGR